jgi:hypothetical protein
MSQARLLSVPVMDENAPYCTLAALECVLKYRDPSLHLGGAYGWHTISYRRESELRVDEKVDVNLALGRFKHAALEAHVRDAVLSAHGYRVRVSLHSSFRDYRAALIASVDADQPLVSAFNLGFMPHRREFRNWYQAHFLVAVGYDEHCIHYADQYNGTFTIPQSIVEECVSYFAEQQQPFETLELEQASATGNQADHFRAQLAFNLDNLSAQDGLSGLSALRAAAADLRAFFDQDPQRRFGIPGIWTMAPERNGARSWLAHRLRQGWPEHTQLLAEAAAVYQPLIAKWHSANRYSEKSFVSQQARDTRSAIRAIEECLPLEAGALELLTEVQRLEFGGTLEPRASALCSAPTLAKGS